jgi:predicted acylesterase/phospholipase RssA
LAADAPFPPTPCQPPEPPKPEPDVEQLRVAMALNGGVSLAVWMGGCAVELDRARRSGFEDEKEPSIYKALCRCFGRRLVLDILTGSSAGGINGALLAAAMVEGRRLDADFVRERWLDLGDLSKILRNEQEQSPISLMDGVEFHEHLLTTFKAVLGSDDTVAGVGRCGPSVESHASIPSLDVTMTDVVGVERRFRDAWGGELIAREHRPRFEFRKRRHFTDEALAAAARTSASFPFAFEPWSVSGNPCALAGLEHKTYGIDGGLLDNAPIRAALDLIPTRSAYSQVRRYFCYMNADPTVREELNLGQTPGLREVGGYIVNLPRTAPLVDHLYAIQEAVERPKRASDVQEQLLKMDLPDLEATARSLFAPYCHKRTIESLEELLPEPGDATSMQGVIEKSFGRLPWIPPKLEAPAEDDWEWGQRPAQRILHLLLDVLRSEIAAAKTVGHRRALLDTRIEIDKQLRTLGDVREAVTGIEAANDPSHFEKEAEIVRVEKAIDKARQRMRETRAAVDMAAKKFRRCIREQEKSNEEEDAERAEEIAATFFGKRTDPKEEQFRSFFRRVLAIEVVRRSLAADSDIDSAEELCFVQLTPSVTSPIFTRGPLNLRSPSSAGEKLTGVGLGHFAGFFRRSWRANDFMWGRLDAAARIVDLLLDSPSPEFGTGAGAPTTAQQITERSHELASALVGSLDDPHRAEREWLLTEALEADRAPATSREEGVRRRVACAIERELIELQEREEKKKEDGAERESDDGRPLPFTRAVFQRAAQLEIVRAELPLIQTESRRDRHEGSAAKPLDLEKEMGERDECDERGGTRAEIEAVRKIYGSSSLPKRLSDPAEPVSDLGLRTITHATFVALTAIRTAGVPMSKYLGLARPPLLAVAGTVARDAVFRLTAVLGFWAAAVYLTSRLVTTSSTEDLLFSSVWSLATLVALVAALAVAGALAVPGLRLWRHASPVRNLFYLLALLAGAGGVGVVWGTIVEGFDVQTILFAPGSDAPEEWVLLTVLALLGVISLGRLPLPGALSKLPPWLEKVRLDGRWVCVPLIAAFCLLSAYAGQTLFRTFDGRTWKLVASMVAVVVAPLAACALVGFRPRLKRNKKREEEAAEPAKKPRPTA